MGSSLASPLQPGVHTVGCTGRVSSSFAGVFLPPDPYFGSPTEGRCPFSSLSLTPHLFGRGSTVSLEPV